MMLLIPIHCSNSDSVGWVVVLVVVVVVVMVVVVVVMVLVVVLLNAVTTHIHSCCCYNCLTFRVSEGLFCSNYAT